MPMPRPTTMTDTAVKIMAAADNAAAQRAERLRLKRLRERIAKAAMQGMLASGRLIIQSDMILVCDWSVRYADALLAELAKPKEKT